MTSPDYLASVMLPENGNGSESLRAFYMRVMTSQHLGAKNQLGQFIFKNITNGTVIVDAMGLPEGSAMWCNVQSESELEILVSVTQRGFRLQDGSVGRLLGCTFDDCYDIGPELVSDLAAKASDILGQIGLYANADLTGWTAYSHVEIDKQA